MTVSSILSLKHQSTLREQGRCVRCGSAPLVTKNHCQSCREKVNDAVYRRYYRSARKTDRVYGAIRKYILAVATIKETFTALDFPNLTVRQARSNLQGLVRDGLIIPVRKSPPGNRYDRSLFRLAKTKIQKAA